MSALTAYDTARVLATHGLTSDTATRADMDAAADHAGIDRPADNHDRHTIRAALDAIGGGR
ncbi:MULTISPECIES: hypothetical protein [Streptomyces]|uniref:Uncharacterized protein n=1 Tax=Streptomyces griseosporeus TaxID=1910 RepID=A0ABV3KU67_STRGS|nr:hypothetical protein [Streptomyces actuosus]MBM4819825.1 hypothetical protein [Streptomyces actuosus]